MMASEVISMLKGTLRAFRPATAPRRQAPDLAALRNAYRVGYKVDRSALRREFPDVALHDFETWAKAQDWNTFLGATAVRASDALQQTKSA
jgi:hypothetical protein